jgi:CYTH domain-containing protein
VKYARIVRERRFLLDAVPAEVYGARRIDDLYIAGTTLRLRHADGAHKLGQKVRPDPGDPSVVHHTTMYLSGSEYDLLSALPGDRLTKTRWSWDVGGRTWSVDEVAGVVLAEIELVGDGDAVDAPPAAVADVSHDERYSGAALAAIAGGR